VAGKRASGQAKTKDSGGFKVLVSDTKVEGSMRFAVSYDPLYGMTGVVGYGPTKAKAIEQLEKSAARYHDQRRAQEGRDYDEEKERRIRDDDY
jgi:hypothetical protein